MAAGEVAGSCLILVTGCTFAAVTSEEEPSLAFCHSRTPLNRFIYLMASLRISFLLSFLSGGCVGTSRRSSANALLTFCCRHLSRVLVKNFLGALPLLLRDVLTDDDRTPKYRCRLSP